MAKIKTLEIESFKQVFPDMCNPNLPQMFGGALWSLADELAHTLVLLNLSSSDTANNAVTHAFSGKFVAEPRMGDVLFMQARIKECRRKGIGVDVNIVALDRFHKYYTKVAELNFGFVTKHDKQFIYHNLEMPDDAFSSTPPAERFK